MKSPAGRVVHDDRGNAVWQPDQPCRSEQTVIEKLNIGELSLSDDLVFDGNTVVTSESGFNPYSSGAVRRTEGRVLKTDLRALSEEIKRKKLQGGGS